MERSVSTKPGQEASAQKARVDLAWAEIAGLVRMHADGSWSPTELARLWLSQAETRAPANGLPPIALVRAGPIEPRLRSHPAGGGGGAGCGRAKISF